LLAAPGGATVSACVELLQSMMSQYDDFAHALATDGRFGWHQRNFHYWHGTDRLTQAQLPAEVITAAIEAMDSIVPHSPRAARVLDVGSGFGFPTVTIAERYPASTVLGIDYHAGSVVAATERAVHASLADRVSFQTASATDLPGADYTLITYFDSLHDFGEPLRRCGRRAAYSHPAAQSWCVTTMQPIEWPTTSIRWDGCITRSRHWCARQMPCHSTDQIRRSRSGRMPVLAG
jgi:SAM-dependent methyltransferase